jgi:hypothetical protein
MKTLLKYIAIGIAMLFLTAFTSVNNYLLSGSNPNEQLKRVFPIPIEDKLPKIKLLPEVLSIRKRNHTDFLDAIGIQESNSNYQVVNSYGYMGKYQFGKQTLKGLGYRLTEKEFITNPTLQEQAMQKLLKSNKKSLGRYIEKYDGKVIHGIYVTESGILAAAHLGGVGNVGKFFSTGKDFQDGNGTRLTTYMKKFSGYRLYL